MAPLRDLGTIDVCLPIQPALPSSSRQSESQERAPKHKRRFCRAPGCNRIVKSQGLCQRHGAKPRKCSVEACTKQAQGNYNGMCKSHFRMHRLASAAPAPAPFPPTAARSDDEEKPPFPPMQGESVYDRVIPESLAWKPAPGKGLMPLIKHLKEGFHAGKPTAWHRNEERLARGLWPVDNPAAQLEGWERELVWTEILLLTGNVDASFRHLARGWGRDKGFHTVLAQFICQRHGDVERKKKDRAAAVAAARQKQQPHPSPLMRAQDASASSPLDYDGALEVGNPTWEEDDPCYFDIDYNDDLSPDLFSVFANPDRQPVSLTQEELPQLYNNQARGLMSDYSGGTTSDGGSVSDDSGYARQYPYPPHQDEALDQKPTAV